MIPKKIYNYIHWRTLISLLLFSIFLNQNRAECAEIKDGDTIIFTEPVLAVIFEHRKHLSKGIACEECHPGLFDMKSDYGEKIDFTMKGFGEGKYCGFCHNGKRAFSVQDRCTSCHIGVKGYKRMKDAGLVKPGNTERGEK